MSKIVTVDGRKMKVTRALLRGTSSNMQVNIADTLTPIFQYEVLKTRIIQFRSKQNRNNEMWIYLHTGVAELGDDAQIEISRADNRLHYIESIWEGNYGQIPAAASRISVDNIVCPNADVRLDEGEYVVIKILDDEVAAVANSEVEQRVEEFIPWRV